MTNRKMEKTHVPVGYVACRGLFLWKIKFPRQNLTFPVKILLSLSKSKLSLTKSKLSLAKSKLFIPKSYFWLKTFFQFSFFSKVYHSYSKTLYSLKDPQKYFVKTLIFHKNPFIEILFFPFKKCFNLSQPNIS